MGAPNQRCRSRFALLALARDAPAQQAVERQNAKEKTTGLFGCTGNRTLAAY